MLLTLHTTLTHIRHLIKGKQASIRIPNIVKKPYQIYSQGCRLYVACQTLRNQNWGELAKWSHIGSTKPKLKKRAFNSGTRTQKQHWNGSATSRTKARIEQLNKVYLHSMSRKTVYLSITIEAIINRGSVNLHQFLDVMITFDPNDGTYYTCHLWMLTTHHYTCTAKAIIRLLL